MRKLGYLFVGWIVLGFSMNGLVMLSSGDVSGLVMAAVAGAGLVWLVRSYRRGSDGMGLLPPAVRSLADQFARLDERLPADPLDNGAIVTAWSLHLHDPAASEELHAQYDAVRRTLSEARAELDAAPEAATDARRRRLEAKLAEVRDYLRAVDTLAEHEPELVEAAIAEHAQASAAVEQARGNGVPVEQLVAADAKLRGARDALRKAEERPLDALRLADEAERLVGAAPPSAAEGVKELLASTVAALQAAADRHPPSALAEVRGLPALAAEQLEHAADDPSALTAAEAIVRRVESHLLALERAAAVARPTLEAAEEAVDGAISRGDAAATRAAELTAAARRELQEEKPDWLEISSLADRALRLLDEPVDHLTPAPTADEARGRAQAAREEVWSWALTVGPRAEAAKAVAEHVDALLGAAERHDSNGGGPEASELYREAADLAEQAVDEASRPPTRSTRPS
jgi:hypothetical protein